ncbi:MAG TPA: tetratricopeptide repeat protein [Bryobacteraceae bacterium]|nr:tetratricopeptide repeat protein [Bryobacteraceae bacterium]
MKRWFLAASVMLCALAQQQPPKKQQPAPKAGQQKEEEPPEEDESLKPKVYVLNPLEAQRNVTAGDYYFKKGKYPAAQWRYTEATKWDPGSAEAFFKLGEVDEKMGNRKGARAAFKNCVDLASEAKLVSEAKKKLEKLK